MGFLFKNSPPTDAVKRSVETNADGSQTMRTEFKLEGTPRPVEMAVVSSLDDALARLGAGAEVMHAIDPARLLSFERGGPPVWSVGFVEVPGPRPYTLLLTYGFSHVLSPEPLREGLNHEYSFAVPAGTPLAPWADAFLRSQCRYVLTQGADIRPNDCVPFRGVPMTRIPFQPAHHAMMPDSALVGMLCTPDPVLPVVQTPRGPIEVRRLVCIDARELDRTETWSAKGFLEELRRADPLLLSPLTRPCLLDDAAFRTRVDERFATEGSDIDAALFEVMLDEHDEGIDVVLPESPEGRQRLVNALEGRVGFGRRLAVLAPHQPPLLFVLGDGPSRFTSQGIEVTGDLSTGDAGGLFRALQAGDEAFTLRV